MRLRGKVLSLAVVSVVVAAGISASAALQPPDPRETGPVYSIEGAWYGITTFPSLGPQPTFDTFTSNAQRPGREGTFLCTIPAQIAGGMTPSGHGNWVRIGTNKYAFTAVRIMMSGSAPGSTFVGLARFWGTITAVSDDELTGTMNAQFYLPDGTTPISPVFAGTLERHRIEITFEQ
jgi:hypothetical protein